MEAKDTVMSDEEIRKLCIKHYTELWNKEAAEEIGEKITLQFSNKLAKAQAEISFKAGIREVVEWIWNEAYEDLMDTDDFARWQAQKKKWGVDNG